MGVDYVPERSDYCREGGNIVEYQTVGSLEQGHNPLFEFSVKHLMLYKI